MICARYRMIKIATALLLLGWVQGSYAEQSRPRDPDYIFYKATRYYEAAQYDEAIAEYHLLLKQGLESGPLYYNLGNCYFKKGELGRAILNYERARRITPSDGDLESNYEYAKSFIKGNPPEALRVWYSRGIDKLFKGISINGLTILLSMIYTFSMAILIASLYFQVVKRYSVIVLSILAMIFTFGAFSLYERISLIGQEAIVITETAEAKFEPFDRAGVHFTLYEGIKVRVLHSKGDWIKIRASDKKAGWIKASSIEVI